MTSDRGTKFVTVLVGPMNDFLKKQTLKNIVRYQTCCHVRNGVTAIYGKYVDDELEGKAKIMFEGGDWFEG